MPSYKFSSFQYWGATTFLNPIRKVNDITILEVAHWHSWSKTCLESSLVRIEPVANCCSKFSWFRQRIASCHCSLGTNDGGIWGSCSSFSICVEYLGSSTCMSMVVFVFVRHSCSKSKYIVVVLVCCLPPREYSVVTSFLIQVWNRIWNSQPLCLSSRAARYC